MKIRLRAALTSVAALTVGTPGRRYILGGENLTLKQILDRQADDPISRQRFLQ